jgi:hypothetical protein
MTLRMSLAALLVAVPLYAQTQPVKPNYFLPSGEFNKDLPKWLKFNGAYQGRVEGFSGGGGFKKNTEDGYYLNRFRVGMNINAATWLRFGFQMQDARVYGKNGAHVVPWENTVDLRAAWVEFGDSENKKYGLRVGRQELVFGEMRLIGHLNWLNTARSFDAVKATYRWKGTRFDAFASTVVTQVEGEFDRAFRNKADNLHGIWVNAPKLMKDTVIEPYILWRVSRGFRSELGPVGKRSYFNYGIRFVGKVPKSAFDYNIEMNKQAGTAAGGDLSAFGGHWMIGYTKAKMKWAPKFMVEYNYASGDSNPTDGKTGTFDQMYPTGHDKTGFADQVGWRNVQNLQLAMTVKPTAKLSFTPRYHWLWLANAKDALYNAGGNVVVRNASGSAGKYIGTELDLIANYAATKQMTLQFGYAHVFPGTFLKKTTPGEAYKFPFLMVQYNF